MEVKKLKTKEDLILDEIYYYEEIKEFCDNNNYEITEIGRFLPKENLLMIKDLKTNSIILSFVFIIYSTYGLYKGSKFKLVYKNKKI